MFKITRKLVKATYDYETFNRLKDGAIWGETLTCHVMNGKAAREYFNKKYKPYNKNYKLMHGKTLLEECLYIFRWDRTHTKLIPARVSMHPKTIANYDRGSQRFNPNYNITY